LQAFLLSYACGILWYAGTCYWIFDTMRQYGGLNTPAALLALFLFCCYLGLYHGAFGLLLSLMVRRGRDYRLALVTAPCLWVAVELARTRITGFPWNLLGISQVENVALCRLSSWTGVYGISFEIVLVNVALAAAFVVPKKKRGALLVAGLAAASVLQAGRLIDAPPFFADHAALLVQQNLPVAANWTTAYFQQTLSDLTRVTVKGAASIPPWNLQWQAPKVNLIVWPESSAPFYASDPLFRHAVGEMARQTQTALVVGSIGTNPAVGGAENPSATSGPAPSSKIFNSASLVSPQGDFAARYDKVHLVPFGEYLPFPSVFSFAGGLTKEVGEFEHGTSRDPLIAEGVPLGVFICYESIFPDEVRQFANNGAQVLVNISNDGWYGDSGAYAQHLNQTRMRAIENDRWLLSATNTGVTASIDPLGRIASRMPRKVRATLIAPYALTSVTTFYTRHGDWFAYACAIISLGAVLFSCASHAFRKERKG
jgi:apolipoprotein N-acyltransferase